MLFERGHSVVGLLLELSPAWPAYTSTCTTYSAATTNILASAAAAAPTFVFAAKVTRQHSLKLRA